MIATLGLYDFFYATYRDTPREKLLKILKDAPDFEVLLPQLDLAKIASERFAQAVLRDPGRRDDSNPDGA